VLKLLDKLLTSEAFTLLGCETLLALLVCESDTLLDRAWLAAK